MPDPYKHWPPVYPPQTSWWRPPRRIQYIHTPVGWTPSLERLCSPSGEKSFNIHKSDGASLLLVEFIFAPTKIHLILTKVREKFNTKHCHSNTVWKIFTHSRNDHIKVSKFQWLFMLLNKIYPPSSSYSLWCSGSYQHDFVIDVSMNILTQTFH